MQFDISDHGTMWRFVYVNTGGYITIFIPFVMVAHNILLEQRSAAKDIASFVLHTMLAGNGGKEMSLSL